MKILVIHGPNLNLLGTREPEIYGTLSLAKVDAMLVKHGHELEIDVSTFQSNHEGAIVDRIQEAAATGVAAIVINPGAYTHTSLAIADAIRAVKTPVVEVHLSNLYARGVERHTSVTAAACRGIVSGFGVASYLLGLEAARVIATPSRRDRSAAKPARERRRGARRPK